MIETFQTNCLLLIFPLDFFQDEDFIFLINFLFEKKINSSPTNRNLCNKNDKTQFGWDPSNISITNGKNE